jgi:bifunctional non-homologous end joining protein LigD
MAAFLLARLSHSCRSAPTYSAMLWRNSPGRSRRTPPAGFIVPCQPLLVPKPPAGSGWLHEVKHDGYRIIARKDGSRVTLWSRYGANFTDRLPKIAEAVCSLAAESALIDGEAVAVRADGHSDCAGLRTKAGSARACLVAFDLLILNGRGFPSASDRGTASRAFAARRRRWLHFVQ